MTFEQWIKTASIHGQDKEQALREAWEPAIKSERDGITKSLQAHLTERQVVIVTKITDKERDVAIRECIAIIENRSANPSS